MPLLVVFPVGVFPILGYAIAAVRSSAADASAPPPPWSPLGRILLDGLWTATLIAILTAPFVGLAWLLDRAALVAVWPLTRDPFLRAAFAALLAAAIAAFPWGCLLLTVVPAAVARYARSGVARDLFDLRRSLVVVRRRFATWNLVVVAIVTAWALGLAGAGLLCVGVIPGVLFAILVSSHAAAALADA
jgi:hypothetical protein